MGNYILAGKTPVLCEDIDAFMKWFEKHDRYVAKTTVGDKLVSTVFLCIDHSFGLGGKPLLFETMIFPIDENGDEYQERCSTWEEAEAMHERAVMFAK